VQAIIAQRDGADEEGIAYTKMSGHEMKTREMEQQVEILKLENELSKARVQLGNIRKLTYREE